MCSPGNRVESVLCVLRDADAFLEETVHLVDGYTKGIPEKDTEPS
jgi:hypothetical protein